MIKSLPGTGPGLRGDEAARLDLTAEADYAPIPVATPSGSADTDPIVALATPRGESALAVIRTTGAGSIELASGLFRGGGSPARAPGHTLLHGRIVDPADGTEVDDVLLAVFRSPRSYTGEDGVEVSCHGGPAVVARIIGLFFANGFRPASPGEFTLRAYLNGRMDLTRAEAVNDIVRARSERARSLALGRLSGAVASRVDAIKARVVSLLGLLELALDYPEDEVDVPAPRGAAAREVLAEVTSLLGTYATGRLIQEGARVAIAGRPNAGKSTLFNLLLREDRSIVSESPGTTRDYVEGAISIQGYGLRLYDTAGLRETEGEDATSPCRGCPDRTAPRV
jgi:tRNA modification GTPase